MNNEFLPRNGQRPRAPKPYFRRTTPQTLNYQRPSALNTTSQSSDDDPTPALPAVPDPAPKGPRPPKKSLKERWMSLSQKKRIIIVVAAVVLLLCGGFAVYHFFIKDEPVKNTISKKEPTKKQPPAPTTVASSLTGLQVAPEVNQNPVTAVMIENSPDARPQSGLNEAGVVFEAVAEGGITRFLTLWQDTQPENIGPVRSVRPYYVQWLAGFDAAVAHVGGSADALNLIKSQGIKDLDQFHNPGPYWRVSSKVAPHNMYSSIVKLRARQVEKGWNKSEFTGFARKAKEAPSAAPTARTIDFNISSPLYNSHYDYDAATNTYKRSEGGKAHTDANTSAQIDPKVVIGMVMPQGRNGIYTTYNTIGSGTAYVFQDGGVTEGTWTKSSLKSNFTFKDANGNEIKLNPGRTWLTVVGGTDRVNYTP